MVAWPGVAGRSKGLKNDPGANITHPLLKIIFLFSKVGYVREQKNLKNQLPSRMLL